MLINSIEAVTKDRSRVTLCNGEQFVMYKGELRLFVIKAGEDLSEETYERIMHNILPRRAKLRMMALLKQRDYTAYQLSTKLLNAGYPQSIVEEALQYVESYGYVDDYKYALAYIKEQMQLHSKKEIYQKLLQKGISRENLEAAFSKAYESEESLSTSSFDEKALIQKTLLKKGFTGNESYEEKQKLLAYFYRRGFSMDDVYHVMDEMRSSE